MITNSFSNIKKKFAVRNRLIIQRGEECFAEQELSTHMPYRINLNIPPK